MPAIPRDHRFDSTLALLRDPYRYIARRCKELDSDVFETRLMLRPTLCMTGAQAAARFYDADKFTRHRAAPRRVRKTLFGAGGVQGLDGQAHRHRKHMFLSIMTPSTIDALTHGFVSNWQRAAQAWGQKDVTLYNALHPILGRTALAWAGIPEPQLELRTRELVPLFDKAGSVGPPHWWSRVARKLANRWAAEIVKRIRDGQLEVPEQSAAYTIAMHRDIEGKLLDERVAAVEVINILRPIVAVSVYVVLTAHALQAHRDYRDQLQRDTALREAFVNEVRRYYPFFPSVVARVRQDFEWNGRHFPGGRRVLLDIYGTNHDARTWDNPDEFQPERFQGRNVGQFQFIPQGGGDHASNHRCAGEWVTVALMQAALKFLLNGLTYTVPPQDLVIDFQRMPALPRSRFMIRNARTR
jgi:fatty-acid peroxygenase